MSYENELARKSLREKLIFLAPSAQMKPRKFPYKLFLKAFLFHFQRNFQKVASLYFRDMLNYGQFIDSKICHLIHQYNLQWCHRRLFECESLYLIYVGIKSNRCCLSNGFTINFCYITNYDANLLIIKQKFGVGRSNS